MSDCTQDSRIASKGYVSCNYTPLGDTFWSAATPTNSIYHAPRGGGDGVVGINTKTPNKALTVVGDISGTTNITVGDSLTNNRVLSDLTKGGLYSNSIYPTIFPLEYVGATINPGLVSPPKTELFIDGNAGSRFIAQSGYTYSVKIKRALAANPTGGTAVWDSNYSSTSQGLVGQLVNRDGALQWDHDTTDWPAFAVNEAPAWSPTFVTTGNTLNVCRIRLEPTNHSQSLKLTVSGLTDTTAINWRIWLSYESFKY